jgi:hypothetical protein
MFGNPNDKFERDYPLGEYVHIDLPNDYDPAKVELSRDFATCISRASLHHRTWYVHRDCYREFMDIIDSGKALRYGYSSS